MLASRTLMRLNSGDAPTQTNHRSMLRFLLLEFPLVVVFAILSTAWIVQRSYHRYVVPLTQSYKRRPINGNFYDEFNNEFTYYNRWCTGEDISTTNSTDLLIREDMTREEAADVMLDHGAVAFRDILDNETASELRKYLTKKNVDLSVLGINELFWDGGDGMRVALALGAGDHPIVREAMEQVGKHKVLRTALEGILGPDPAIVEISTLTAKSGCDDQDLHSDSDWFGSSLLYSRTFLHSYSLFIALQDTPDSMGATKVCPGSHYCADIDLTDICLNNGAFQVSTNGYTGEKGLLRRGDAFMFNQNIWHGGPANQENMDRVMFIMTFVSRTEFSGDRRRQGLGTFYYQRWNNWGHTFEDLKDAGTVLMQPLAAIKALGIWKLPGRNWGIPWIHQLCQQMANGEDFYADFELEDFQSKILDYFHIPKYLRSPSDSWEEFIPETMQLWMTMLMIVYVGTAVTVVLINVVLLSERRKEKALRYSFVQRMFFSHAVVVILIYTASTVVEKSKLAKSITTEEIFVRPFPAITSDSGLTSFESTTLPERNDVLIGTRFDAEFLASFNRFLDKHPGNKSWRSSIKQAAFLPAPNLRECAAKAIVSDLTSTGVRFLLQDYKTGAWKIMTNEKSLEETYRALTMEANPVVGQLAIHLKSRLAEYRFGNTRETVWAKRFGPAKVMHWLSILFRESSHKISVKDVPAFPKSNVSSFLIHHRLLVEIEPQLKKRTADRNLVHSQSAKLGKKNADLKLLRRGDFVWAFDSIESSWHHAILVELYEDEDGEEVWLVEFFNGEIAKLYRDNIRKYFMYKEGDHVEVDYNRNKGQLYSGIITHIFPNGNCIVFFDDGEILEGIGREYLYPLLLS